MSRKQQLRLEVSAFHRMVELVYSESVLASTGWHSGAELLRLRLTVIG